MGITGSVIMEPDMDMIVELGAFVSWSIGTWKPNYRNNRLSAMKEVGPTEVDYVAACSSLVRNEALYKIGVMDRGTSYTGTTSTSRLGQSRRVIR